MGNLMYRTASADEVTGELNQTTVQKIIDLDRETRKNYERTFKKEEERQARVLIKKI